MSDVLFASSGCTLLDLELGGGYALGKMSNVFGAESTGKTQQCIELASNFLNQYPSGKVWYVDAEAAFDESYAERLGMPVDDIEFPEIDTIEELFVLLSEAAEELAEGQYGAVFIDSLDALSSDDEMGRDIKDGTYGGAKPKKMSEMFRRLARILKDKNMLVFIVSQIRDKIGVTYGKQTMVTGGRALKFYASQRVELSLVEKLYKEVKVTLDGDEDDLSEEEEEESAKSSTKKKFKAKAAKSQDAVKKTVKKPIGVRVKAYVAKSKCGDPFGTVEYNILFGYGIDDLRCNLDYLAKFKQLKNLKCADGLVQVDAIINKRLNQLSDDEFEDAVNEIRELTRTTWRKVKELTATDRRSKY